MAFVPVLAALAGAAATLVVLGALDHYRTPISPTMGRRFGDLMIAAILGALAACFAQGGAWNTSTTAFLAAATFGALVVDRAAVNSGLVWLRCRGRLVEPVLIVGAGQVGVELAELLREHREYGLAPIGFIDSVDDADALPLPLLGSVHSLSEILARERVRRVIVAYGLTSEPDMVPILRACDMASVDIHVVPRFFELGHSRARDVDLVWGFPLRRLRRSAIRRGPNLLKRAFDVVVASVLLVILAPIYGATALAVRLSSRGPVLFRQLRVGRGGNSIEVLKFRSLEVNEDSNTDWSVEDDPRTTAVGRFIRRTCLDELPQLINVLRGDMSLVGPRPERPYFANRFAAEIPGYDDRHRMPVGLTGWAQVHGLRGDTSIQERARFDNDYIENWTLLLDFYVVARTIGAVLRRERPGATGPAPRRAPHLFSMPASDALGSGVDVQSHR
jgi:exopolysaccharide biosynthesis polyprenyl glycosylphosphotransferase